MNQKPFCHMTHSLLKLLSTEVIPLLVTWATLLAATVLNRLKCRLYGFKTVLEIKEKWITLKSSLHKRLRLQLLLLHNMSNWLFLSRFQSPFNTKFKKKTKNGDSTVSWQYLFAAFSFCFWCSVSSARCGGGAWFFAIFFSLCFLERGNFGALTDTLKQRPEKWRIIGERKFYCSFGEPVKRFQNSNVNFWRETCPTNFCIKMDGKSDKGDQKGVSKS